MTKWFLRVILAPVVKALICAKEVRREDHDVCRLYTIIFSFFFMTLGFSLGGLIFVFVNLGIHIDRINTSVIAIGICAMVSFRACRNAQRMNFIEDCEREIEGYSLEKMKKYINRIMLGMYLPISLYPLLVVFVCYLLQVYVFHK